MTATRCGWDKLTAIDMHVHAEVSCHDPEDPIFGTFLDGSTKYFKAPRQRPTIPETIAHYRARNMGLIMFTVDMEAGTGICRMGTGMPGGGGIRLKYGQPVLVDDVAVDFPEMKIVLAHPSWPWTDESLSMALHKPNVFIDLSGWSPKYFPPQIARYANTQLWHKMLFGSDYPLISPKRWIAAFDEASFKPHVREPILKTNALDLLFGTAR